MGLQLLTRRRSAQMAGVLSCYGCLLIQGPLPGLCHAEGMTGYLDAQHVRLFDAPSWAQPLSENAGRLAAENHLEIEFIRRTQSFRKEDSVDFLGHGAVLDLSPPDGNSNAWSSFLNWR